MKTGFIGTGNMGSLLIESFLRSGALIPTNIIASNRTAHKAEKLADRYKGLRVARSNKQVAQESDLIFLCIKPLEYKKVIEEIKETVTSSQIVASITSPVMVSQLEEQLDSKIVKLIPSITNYVLSGSMLCVYGSRMTGEDRQLLKPLLQSISEPIEVEENFIRVSSDITSCGPAFLAYYLEQFIEAAVHETGIERGQASELAAQMLVGTGKLLTEGDFSPKSLRQHVSVPGGITAEGLRLMDTELNGMFNQLFKITHTKYNDDVAKVALSFADQVGN